MMQHVLLLTPRNSDGSHGSEYVFHNALARQKNGVNEQGSEI